MYCQADNIIGIVMPYKSSSRHFGGAFNYLLLAKFKMFPSPILSSVGINLRNILSRGAHINMRIRFLTTIATVTIRIKLQAL